MLNDFFINYKSQNKFDRFNYLLIFLFPLFSISIRHWTSRLFGLLFLFSIVYFFLNKNNFKPLLTEEKYYIYILLFYFAVFLLSAFVNGWGGPQTHILGTMLRFIAIIPIIIMFRNLKYVLPILVVGSIVACLFNIVYLFFSSTSGVYSHLFSGPMTFLFSVFIVPVIMQYRLNIVVKIILIITLLLSTLTIFNLGSRSAFVAIFLVIFFYGSIYVKNIYRLYLFVLVVILSIGIYHGNDNVKIRIDKVAHGVSVYFSEENTEQSTQKFNTVHDIAARFEMWRAGKFFVIEDPVLGFGPNEFENEINILIDKKLINSVAKASHPHNAYLHELFAKGFMGLIAMLLVLYYPAYIFIKYYKSMSYESILGLSVIISFSAFSLTESAAFNNNNFSSNMLVYISIILVSLFQAKRSRELVE